jgi:adenylate cyclase, class 2
MSWVEVESKIKVSNVDDARVRIKKIAKFVGNEHKKDDYYTLEKISYPKKSLRVRDKGKKREVNFKEWRSYKYGIWAKKEVEFTVSDLNNFFDLLDDFGFRKWMSKEKKTELYRTKDGVNIELNYVKNLGWFIEIEILSKDGGKNIDDARRKIRKIMDQLGVKKKLLRKKGYTKMLWELRH